MAISVVAGFARIQPVSPTEFLRIQLRARRNYHTRRRRSTSAAGFHGGASSFLHRGLSSVHATGGRRAELPGPSWLRRCRYPNARRGPWPGGGGLAFGLSGTAADLPGFGPGLRAADHLASLGHILHQAVGRGAFGGPRSGFRKVVMLSQAASHPSHLNACNNSAGQFFSTRPRITARAAAHDPTWAEAKANTCPSCTASLAMAPDILATHA